VTSVNYLLKASKIAIDYRIQTGHTNPVWIMKQVANVHYGCGLCAPDNWLNFDASLTLRFERLPFVGRLYKKNLQCFPVNVRYGDIVKGLPINAGSCDAVYCSHILDYLTYEDCKRALRNTKQILRPGGTFRLVVQDCSLFIKQYLADGTTDASIKFMDQTGWGRRTRPRRLIDFAIDHFGHSHRLWMWDFKALYMELAQAGFHSIRRAEFGDSENPAFSNVEDIGRWKYSVAIDCKA
jgi:SAM-dependent methyltransferase